MGLTHEDVERILRLIDESGYEEIRIEYGDLKLHMRRRGSEPGTVSLASPLRNRSSVEPSRSQAGTTPAPTLAASSLRIPEGAVVLRAPMLGTFYRSPSPGAPPFVEVGSEVCPETTVCLIEVMKLFNSLKAATEGRVLQILAESGAMVEYDQPLIVIEPKAKG